MLGRGFVMAAAIVMLAAASAPADQTLRLGGTGDARVSTLLFDGDADVLAMQRGGGHRGFHGGHRGFHGGHRGFHGGHHGFHGGHRHHGFHHGFHRVHHHHGFHHHRFHHHHGFHHHRFHHHHHFAHHRPFHWGYHYPYYHHSSFYVHRPYYYPTYYYPTYSLSGYYSPCSLTADAGYLAPEAAPGSSTPAPIMPPANAPNGPNGVNGQQTYPYDGGPRAPVPGLLEQQPAGQPSPKPALPRDVRFVSLPSGFSGETSLTFAAYGDVQATPVRWVVGRHEADVADVAEVPLPASPVQFAYPAYGEQPRTSAFATQR